MTARPTSNDWFDAFYRALYKPLWSRALLFGASRSEAEDLVQDVMVSIYKNSCENKPPGFPQWSRDKQLRYASGALVRRQKDTWRRLGRRARLDRLLFPRDQITHVEPKILESDLFQQIATKLTKRQREVVVLHWMGFTADEIADLLHTAASTVRTHKQRGLRQLSSYLGSSESGGSTAPDTRGGPQ